jgi:cysteine desulfurase
MQTEEQPASKAGQIYLDYQASTPLDPRALAAMMPYLTGPGGNPHATGNVHGMTAMSAVQRARVQIATLLGCEPGEVVFTSGATEANNLLIRGCARTGMRVGRNRIVTVATEHHAVLDVVRQLGLEGCEVIEVGVDGDGLVLLDELARAINSDTALVSIMAVNNEIGVMQPLRAIAGMCGKVGALLHTDAAQAAGKMALAVHGLGIDLLSLSSHKVYGPMGVGAAFIGPRARRRVEPLMQGGGQEGGLRSGTLPVALCVGFGAACELAGQELDAEWQRLTTLRDCFLARLAEAGTEFQLNGSLSERIPGNLNISFRGVDAEALLMRVRGKLSISTGSACTTESLEPSHVVAALGAGRERAEAAIRIGFGRPTTAREVEEAAGTIINAVARLRSVSYTPAFAIAD